ncbi:sensor histidine kinase [Hymenobacter volaticus]|uniref:histidine kinase n=1 Tax=Hymenobacter volaticus TaxID=2932254 RepID=A0ABY4GGU0_9BACT|nr:ATP-binding protein [Hymenobacter volaticus]UOQ69664.1 ATP-binding protein [Hymenobacter volaticus]
MEIEAAKEIRLHISDVRLKVFNELQARAARLSQLNIELERSNDELDSFAYVASHDLKEPLRGIHNYSLFLLEDYAEQLDAEGVDKLQTLVRLSQRMENLIESLLQLSRVGRQDLVVEVLDMNELLIEVVELLAPRFEQTGTTVTVSHPLPVIRGDKVRLREVFNNLLTNAMRYNDRPDKIVEVGVVPAEEAEQKGFANPDDFHVFYVRDNGIGIDPKHHSNIFKLFKRLHGQEKYGGGTGAGLAIVKKMVEKHGGTLWVESIKGEGATFYFSLSKNL